MATLPASADVVIVGGGVVGASTLYALTRAGVTDAVLVERDTVAAGSTSKAVGGIRAQYSDELNIRMALENIDRFVRFGDEFGVDIDYVRNGYLFLLDRHHVDAFTGAVRLQNELGVPTEILTPEEAADLVPGTNLDGIVAASFGPLDGKATPETVAQAYTSAASRAGAKVVQGCEVTTIEAAGGNVTAVGTSHGSVSTPVVVSCAGVWSADLLRPLGIDMPVTAQKRFVWLTVGADPLPRDLPITIDFATGFYFTREGQRLLFGGRHESLEEVGAQGVARLTWLEEMPIRDGWWGYYEMSPDHNAIVGRAAEPDGLFYATGFSGHGFQQAPVIGEYLAALISGGDPPLDLGSLSLERFAAGSPKPEGLVI